MFYFQLQPHEKNDFATGFNTSQKSQLVFGMLSLSEINMAYSPASANYSVTGIFSLYTYTVQLSIKRVNSGGFNKCMDNLELCMECMELWIKWTTKIYV